MQTGFIKTVLEYKNLFNPFALRKAKTPQSFGPFECKRVNSSLHEIFSTDAGHSCQTD